MPTPAIHRVPLRSTVFAAADAVPVNAPLQARLSASVAPRDGRRSQGISGIGGGCSQLKVQPLSPAIGGPRKDQLPYPALRCARKKGVVLVAIPLTEKVLRAGASAPAGSASSPARANAGTN